MDSDIWTARDGRKIPVSEMTDSHLVNTILFLRRRNHWAVWSLALDLSLSALAYASTAPDGAAYAAEQAADGYMTEDGMDDVLADKLPIFKVMLAEARRRRITFQVFDEADALSDNVPF